MNKFFLGVNIFLLLVLLIWPVELVHAGFGITPPYVRNTSLIRNSTYEQTILLVRSDPEAALKATITYDIPGINEWFTIDKGNEFLLPAGEQKVPITVTVTVPDDAEFKQYLGNIRVRTGPPDDTVAAGAVSISLGAQIDVDLNVIDKEIEDFRVRKISISDLNEGHKVGWLYFPGKILFEILAENTGNVPVAPSRVAFRLYDPTGQVLLEETDHTNRIQKIEPFATESVVAELPTRLPAGSYIARYDIYNGDEIKQSGELSLSILPYGTLNAAGYGFGGLSLAHKASVLLPVFVILGIIIAILLKYNQSRTPRIAEVRTPAPARKTTTKKATTKRTRRTVKK